MTAYKIITLKEIATEFTESIEAIKQDLVYLVLCEKIPFRIDSVNGVLQRYQEEPKLKMLRNLEVKGSVLTETMNTQLIRASLQNS